MGSVNLGGLRELSATLQLPDVRGYYLVRARGRLVMSYRHIPLEFLAINRANDRHGELENETAAIAWLFNNFESHMKNLAKDIVGEGEIFEPPLVFPEDEKFVVYDGNRRVTCLKLLDKPKRAPTVELQEFFGEQRAKWNGNFPSALQCQIETDRDRIDDILFRRHTGTQSGVGQTTWDDRMKSNFINRTGMGGPFNVADEIEKRLSAAGMLPRKKIPRSNMNRLFSTETLRNRVGFAVNKGKFELTHLPFPFLPPCSRLDCSANSLPMLGTKSCKSYRRAAFAAALAVVVAAPVLLVAAPQAEAGGWRTVHRYVKRSGTCSGQEILASYYSSGRRTATGEVFDANGNTAAARTWPLGTHLTVTNPKNGRTLTVRVNDRGPWGIAFTQGARLDLARGAARRLGMSGSQYVCVQEGGSTFAAAPGNDGNAVRRVEHLTGPGHETVVAENRLRRHRRHAGKHRAPARQLEAMSAAQVERVEAWQK